MIILMIAKLIRFLFSCISLLDYLMINLVMLCLFVCCLSLFV